MPPLFLHLCSGHTRTCWMSVSFCLCHWCLSTNQVALLGEKDKSSIADYHTLSTLVRQGMIRSGRGGGGGGLEQMYVQLHVCCVRCECVCVCTCMNACACDKKRALTSASRMTKSWKFCHCAGRPFRRSSHVFTCYAWTCVYTGMFMVALLFAVVVEWRACN